MNLDLGFGASAATDALVRATCLLVAAGFVSLAVRRRSPALSTSVWVFAFLGLCLIPLLSSLNSPRFALKWLPAVKSEQLPSGTWTTANVPSFEGEALAADPSSIESSRASGLEPAVTGRQTVSAPPRFQVDPTQAALAVWALGALWVLFRLFLGALRLRRLARLETRPFAKATGARHNSLSRGRREAQALSALRISTTDVPPSAITWGAIKPTIVLPNGASDWAPKELEAVLLHELAHVRRKDSAKQLLAELACALYWFHPLVWLGARAMRLDAELAADEDALRSGIAPSEYASALLQIARGAAGRTSPFQGAGVSAMTHPRIDKRLKSILAPARSTRGMTRVQSLAALLLMGCAVTAFTATTLAPQGADPDATEAMRRAKQLGTAAIMYAADYNDVLPYVQSTASVVPVLSPYVRNGEMFLSPSPGGRFLYNTNVGGVRYGDIAKPSETPLWIERLSNGQIRVVAFVDTHVRKVGDGMLDQVEKALRWTFPRRSNSKPLPKGYLINSQTLASARTRSLIAGTSPSADIPYAPTAAVVSSSARFPSDAPLATAGVAAPRTHDAPVAATAAQPAGTAAAPTRTSGGLAGSAVPAARAPLPSQGGVASPAGGLGGTAGGLSSGTATLSAPRSAQGLGPGLAGTSSAPSVASVGTATVAPTGLTSKPEVAKTTLAPPEGVATVGAPAKAADIGQATTPAASPGLMTGQATAPARAPGLIVGQATTPEPDAAVARTTRSSGVAYPRGEAVPATTVAPTVYRWDGKGFVPVYGSGKPAGKTPKPGLYRWDGRRYVPVPASGASAKRSVSVKKPLPKTPIKRPVHMTASAARQPVRK